MIYKGDVKMNKCKECNNLRMTKTIVHNQKPEDKKIEYSCSKNKEECIKNDYKYFKNKEEN